MNAALKKWNQRDFFSTRVSSIPTDTRLDFDLYIWIDEQLVLFRKLGDYLSTDRMERLIKDGLKNFFIPEEQRKSFISALSAQVKNPSSKTHQKARFIKESAYIHLNDLFNKEDIKGAIADSKTLVEEMVSFISEDIEAATTLMRLSSHDYYTYNHSVNVAVYCIAITRKIFGDDKLLLMTAGFGGLLHDIGKRKIDLSIINKKGALNSLEWKEIKKHPEFGIDCLKGCSNVSPDAKSVVLSHHENFDGTGYPHGIRGDQISKLARICTIADVFDALTTERAYRDAMPPAEALKTMYSMRPGKFDPNLFSQFHKKFRIKGRHILGENFDPCQPADFKKFLK